jgi:hypothetical protein
MDSSTIVVGHRWPASQPAEPAPATYAELSALTRDTTHAEWESALGDSYDSLLRYDPSEESA